MATAQNNLNYNYSNNLDTGANAGDWFSDKFLGTAKQQNKANLAMLNEQNRFTEYMSNTAYQRGMEDMVSAGINPLVMYNQHGGSAAASSPSSGGASAGQYDKDGGMLGKGISWYAKTSAQAVNKFIDNLSGEALKYVMKTAK